MQTGFHRYCSNKAPFWSGSRTHDTRGMNPLQYHFAIRDCCRRLLCTLCSSAAADAAFRAEHRYAEIVLTTGKGSGLRCGIGLCQLSCQAHQHDPYTRHRYSACGSRTHGLSVRNRALSDEPMQMNGCCLCLSSQDAFCVVRASPTDYYTRLLPASSKHGMLSGLEVLCTLCCSCF